VSHRKLVSVHRKLVSHFFTHFTAPICRLLAVSNTMDASLGVYRAGMHFCELLSNFCGSSGFRVGSNTCTCVNDPMAGA
jgi:hypothetical protein